MDFIIYQGDSKDIFIDVIQDGLAQNLSGTTNEWVLQRNGVNILTKNGVVAESQIKISLTKQDTENLNGVYYYILRIIDDVGNQNTVLAGNMIVNPLPLTITLNEAKTFLRIDGNEEDTLLISLIGAAENYLTNAGVTIQNTELDKLAVKLLLTHWYEHREVVGKTDKLAFGLEAILTQLKYRVVTV